MNPKNGPVWKSSKYRRWIRDTQDCFVCEVPLINEKPDFLTHHHHHAGGKNPRDQLLVPLCLACHNRLHANESRFGVSEIGFLKQCIRLLSQYAEELNINAMWVCINALHKEISENEK